MPAKPKLTRKGYREIRNYERDHGEFELPYQAIPDHERFGWILDILEIDPEDAVSYMHRGQEKLCIPTDIDMELLAKVVTKVVEETGYTFETPLEKWMNDNFAMALPMRKEVVSIVIGPIEAEAEGNGDAAAEAAAAGEEAAAADIAEVRAALTEVRAELTGLRATVTQARALAPASAEARAAFASIEARLVASEKRFVAVEAKLETAEAKLVAATAAGLDTMPEDNLVVV